jgi:hypothetical protein
MYEVGRSEALPASERTRELACAHSGYCKAMCRPPGTRRVSQVNASYDYLGALPVEP